MLFFRPLGPALPPSGSSPRCVIELIFRFFKKGPETNYGRGRVRSKHLFCERFLKFHNLGSDFLFLIRESIESKSKKLPFGIVGSGRRGGGGGGGGGGAGQI